MNGFLARLFAESFHVSQSPPAWVTRTFGQDTAAGVEVNEDTALQTAAVFACVRILAETVASLPLITYRRLNDRAKERAKDFYLYPILHDSPNGEMTSMEWRETMQGHLALRGNAFSEIEFSNSGRVRGLWPLHPDKILLKRDKESDELFYEYRLPEKFGAAPKTLPAWRVLHLRGLGSNGLVGYSPIAMARQAIGLSMATEEFGARYFGNGAQPGGVLEHPGILGEEGHKRIKASWDEAHGGLAKSHRIAIIEEGMKYQQVGIAPEDSQFLQTRKFQLSEIARFFRIPPHMLADLDRATFSNIEHMGIEFVVYTLSPWLTRWEQRMALSLLSENERKQYFIEHLVAGLLRGDIQSRYTAYATGRQWGWLSRNDVREIENMNPIEGGDDYLSPLNMTKLHASAEEREVQTRLALTMAGLPQPTPGGPPIATIEGGNGRH